MTIFESIILGVVQGITEFLPVSSSGHLILVREIFSIGYFSGLAFDAVLHFATALAVLVYFRKDIIVLIRTTINLAFRRRVDATQKHLVIAIIIATIPAVIFGFFLEDIMGTLFRNPSLVVITLLIGAGVMYFAEEYSEQLVDKKKALSLSGSFYVGLFQSLALIPGMSRSGMAISGGMFLGLKRAQAARFAFLLAVPLLLGAGSKKMADILLGTAGEIHLTGLIFGAVSAFLVGLAVVHYLLKYLQKNSLMIFVWYRIGLAIVVWLLLI